MTSPGRGALTKLHRALIDLPAPWTVIGSRGDGPPWVRYIALHPEKGIALVDLVAARPDLAIAPLEEFLARTGLAAFADGDPPIVAVALDHGDLSTVEVRLGEAFAKSPPCGIANAGWPEALIDLLMMTSDLTLTRLKAEKADLMEGAPGPLLAPTEGTRAAVLAAGARRLQVAGASFLGGAVVRVAASSRRAAAASARPLIALIVAARRKSQIAARSLKSALRAIRAASFPALRAASGWTLHTMSRTRIALGLAFWTLLAGLTQWSPVAARSMRTAAATAAATSRVALDRATAAAKRASGAIGRVRLHLPVFVLGLRQWAVMNQRATASFAMLAVVVAALSGAAIPLLSGAAPQSEGSPNEAALAPSAEAGLPADELSKVATSAPATPAVAIERPLPVRFDIGGVALRFEPPASYCVFPDARLQTVMTQQNEVNPGNVVHTVFGDCDELRADADNQTRIQDFGVLMTPKAQLDRPMSKAALAQFVARIAGPNAVKGTLDQRLRQAQSRVTLQTFSTLGVMQRDKDATYFAYLFKVNADDSSYTEACVMALTAVKRRLVAYYLYSDYRRDARAALTGLLRKVRAGVGAMQAANG